MTEAAAEYPDGVWWVELAALTDGALVPSAVAQAIGVGVEGERPTALVLRSQLAGKRTLVVLDNCEHLADAVATLIETVTAGAPGVSVLMTSQETIKATDEHVYRLGGPAIPQAADASASHSGAVELFEARAQAVDPRFALTATNLPAVIESETLYLAVQLLDWSAGHRALATVKQTKSKFWRRCHCIDPELLVLHIGRQILIQELLHCFEQLHSVLFHDDRMCALADLDVPLIGGVRELLEIGIEHVAR
jgi:hypothetical protein